MTSSCNRKSVFAARQIRGLIASMAVLFTPGLIAQTNLPSTTNSPPATNSGVGATLNSQINLSPGDVLSFRILQETNETLHLTVTDTGELDIPYIGRVKAAHKNCLILAEEIKTNLETDYFYHATVVLGIDMIHNKRVGRAYVTGQVRSPGPVDIAEDEKLMASDAILHAGGFSEYADRRRVKIMRPMESSSGVTNLYVDVMAVWQQGKRDKDVELKPGDRIYVSSKLINF